MRGRIRCVSQKSGAAAAGIREPLITRIGTDNTDEEGKGTTDRTDKTDGTDKEGEEKVRKSGNNGSGFVFNHY